jgi:GntR family transcriptional regulator of arabinose operon
VKGVLRKPRSDGFVCANDFTAARLLRTLEGLKVSVPRDVRLVGVDDVKYASLLPVPLTTVHQPCAEIGTMAIAAMLERLRHPTMPPRDVLVDVRLVVRASCGSRNR